MLNIATAIPGVVYVAALSSSDNLYTTPLKIPLLDEKPSVGVVYGQLFPL